MRSLTLLLLALASHNTATAARPNVVFILSDNQSYWEFGCHGNPVVKTPHIDRLAAESVDFRHFYATPYCSPSRAEFLTGRYAMRHGIYNTIGGVSLLPTSATTLAEVFRANGYRTGIFGKWHLGESFPMRPEDQGFDEAFWHGGGGVGQLPDYYGNTLFNTTFIENDQAVKTEGFCTDRIFDRAIRFLRTHRDKHFFCYVPTPVTHKPWAAPEEYKQPYLDLGMSPGNAAGYGQMTNLDVNVGRLLKALDRLQLRDNTILIFATDQGMGRMAPAKDMSLPQQRGGHMAYDWANHVAFMIRYPDRIKRKGAVVTGLAGAVDLLPTLTPWCRLTHDLGDRLDGVSLARHLEEPELAWPERDLVSQCPRGREVKKWHNAVVRRGYWRLTAPNELFHVKDDPRQERNLADTNPGMVRELNASYEKWWDEYRDDLPEFSRVVIGHPGRPEVRLTCMDWYRGDTPWTQSDIRSGHGKGRWAVHVARAGRYRVEIRRYPREAGRAAGAVAAAIQIGDSKSETQLKPDAEGWTTTLSLKAGPQDLAGVFRDAKGRDFGSFFAYIRRVD